jgi:DNA-binding CsgD family transcriptional regulator
MGEKSRDSRLAEGGCAAVERWFEEAMLGGDVSSAAQVFAPDVVVHSAAGDFTGIDAVAAATLELRALDDIDGHLELANDGHLLVVTFVVRGRHARSLWAASPTGELLEVHATVTIRTEGERLAELWKTCTVRHIATAPRAGGMEEARSWAQRWRLTVRETSVAELAMNGHADKEIAARLALAPTSVSKYLRAVLRKAGVASRSALAERAGVVHIG